MVESNKIRLNYHGLPIIESVADFSNLTHLSIYSIFQMSKHSEKYYKCFELLKKGGGKRLICQPSRNLKGLQAWILVHILNPLSVSSSCKGFEKKSSIVDNVRPHIDANAILGMDIKDFFGSIKRKYVFNVFRSVGYNDLASNLLTNLCVYEDSLPQGSPCSPKLANLVSWRLDVRIQGYVGRRGITYTRYADDLTFSGLNPGTVSKIKYRIEEIVNDEGYEMNSKKTHLFGISRAKVVTGLILSDGSYGIGTRKYKTLRAKLHYLTKPGEQKNFKLLKFTKGYMAFLKSVDTKRFLKAKAYINKLVEKHPKTLIKELKIK